MAEMIGVIGVNGDGKSHFLRSAAEIGKTMVAACDPNEKSFYAAFEGRLSVDVFADPKWRPRFGQFDATAFNRLMDWLGERHKDDSKIICVDPCNEVSDFAMCEMLKMHQTDDPRQVPYGGAYIGHDRLMKQFFNELRILVARGKWVLCAWPPRMKEREGAGDAEKKPGMSGEDELRFEERLLPVLNTNMRQHIAGYFSGWFFTKLVGFGPGRKYYMTAIPDRARPAKHRLRFKAGTNLAMIPNTLKALIERLEP